MRVAISSCERTLTAEPTTEATWSRSAPMDSAASTHWAATNVAADAIAMSVLAGCSFLPSPEEEAAVAAVMAATAAATAATETAAWTWAL